MKRTLIAILCSAILFPWQAALAAANVAPTGPTTVNVGQTFNVYVTVSGAKDVDTIRLNGSYTQDLLQWKGASPAGVFQNVSPGTYVDQATGIYSFGAFTLSSKANGTARIAVLTFKAIKAGTAYVQLTTNSRILSAGEDQMGTVGRLTINVTQPQVAPKPEQPQPLPPTVKPGVAAISLYSTSHPDPNAWYKDPNVLASWKIEGKTASKVYVGFDQDPQGPAEQVPSDSIAKFTAPTDGVWYVHLGVSFTDKTYQREDLRVQIDRTDPHTIAPVTDQTLVTQGTENYLRFATTDDASGIDHYDVMVDGTLATSTVMTAWALDQYGPGIHTVLVKAYDRAGNMVQGQTSFHVLAQPTTNIGRPNYLNLIGITLFTLFAILAIIFFLLWDRRRREKKKGRVHKR